jgi:hypothetical protein
MTVFNVLRDTKNTYLALLAVQFIGAIFLITTVLPDFRQLALYPGEHWVRLQRLPIPYQGSSIILSHMLLFLGRLSFIFGGALFAVVFFRHVPELDHRADALLMARRGLL